MGDLPGRIPIWTGDVRPWCLPDVKHRWFWVTCVSPFCNHRRAVPLAPWRIRWSEADVFAAMRRRFRCGVCGGKGCVFVEPSTDGQGVAPFPAGREVWMYEIPAEPITQEQIWNGARQIIDLFPEEPELAASTRADKALEEGDLAGFALWSRITKAVMVLVRGKPDGPTAIN